MKNLTSRTALALLGCAVLMLFAAPAWADVCSDAFSAATTPPTGCGVTINITGTSGSLSATISVVGGPYDTLEDQLVGITNSSTATVGAIVLSGPSNTTGDGLFGFDGDGPCVFFGTGSCGPTGYNGPVNTFVGISSDKSTGKVLFTTPLAPGQTTWFALEDTPFTSAVAIGENKPLTANSPTTFKFGNSGVDDYVITPMLGGTGDIMTITPIPVAQSSFSATNFSTLNCIPYKDYNSGNPVCVEIERDCFGSDNCNFLYTAQLDFKIDSAGIPSGTGIGGPRFLGQPDATCPTSGFNEDILVTYIGAIVDPLKGSGTGGHSCWVAAFDPTATPVATNSIVSTFGGLQSPVQPPPKFTNANSGAAVPLTWHQSTSSGSPVTNLLLCPNVNNPDGTCNTVPPKPPSFTPWVSIGTIQIDCTSGLLILGAQEVSAAGGSTLQNLGGGDYRFSLKTTKAQAGTCEAVLFQFNSGVFVVAADLKIK